jgi:hypothetical protein
MPGNMNLLDKQRGARPRFTNKRQKKSSFLGIILILYRKNGIKQDKIKYTLQEYTT